MTRIRRYSSPQGQGGLVEFPSSELPPDIPGLGGDYPVVPEERGSMGAIRADELCNFRRFALYRHSDISGVSGTGYVAVGCQYPNGWCSVQWVGEISSFVFWESIGRLLEVNGHQGRTELVWIDE